MTNTPIIEQIEPNLLAKDPQRAIELAELTWHAATSFYALFPQPREQVIREIAGQLAEPGGEFSNTLVLREAADVALAAGTTLSALPAARIASSLAHLRVVGRDCRSALVERLRSYVSQLEPVPEGSGVYLARFVVAPHARGRGIGRKLMLDYLRRAGDLPVYLHVHRDNLPAVSLYQSFGFQRCAGSDSPFVLLRMFASG